VPSIGLGLIDPAVRALGYPALAGSLSVDLLSLDLAGGSGVGYSGLGLAIAALLLGLIATVALGRLSPARERRGAAWDCGFPDPDPTTQYSANSFSQPLRRVFGPIFRAHERIDMPAPLETRAASFALSLIDPLWVALYRPPARLIEALARRLDGVQRLTIGHYLSFTFTVLVLLMVIVVLSP